MVIRGNKDKLDAFRLRLAQRRSVEEVEKDFVYSIFILMYEMKWSVEYIMEMEIWKFNEIVRNLNRFYEEQKRASEEQSRGGDISSAGTLR